MRIENETENFETQKCGVPYLTRAAVIDPRAMIRMGEVQEQGFYDVKTNPKRAKAYYDEEIRILSLLASKWLPGAAAELGHVYIEGLGTKQDIPRATRDFEFAKKTGYEHPELWLWEHYGVSLRQVAIPERVKEALIKESDYTDVKKEYRNSQTCTYLVREKLYISGSNSFSSIDLPVWLIVNALYNKRESRESIVIYAGLTMVL